MLRDVDWAARSTGYAASMTERAIAMGGQGLKVRVSRALL